MLQFEIEDKDGPMEEIDESFIVDFCPYAGDVSSSFEDFLEP